jgi:anaerobic ribonucleoside-triphosphate reductase activating protein
MQIRVEHIDGVWVRLPASMDVSEARHYVEEQKRPEYSGGKRLKEVEIALCGKKDVELKPHYDTVVRVRRITGYLSTADRFNDAKQAELAARCPSIGTEE